MSEATRAEERLNTYQQELERANDQLRRLPVTDGLTGLKSRAAFVGLHALTRATLTRGATPTERRLEWHANPP